MLYDYISAPSRQVARFRAILSPCGSALRRQTGRRPLRLLHRMSQSKRPSKDIFARFLDERLGNLADRDSWNVSNESVFTFLCHKDATLPMQGWKIHVSSTIEKAECALQRSLPLLLKYRLSFKFVSSKRLLHRLNEGALGRMQVGKFITIYPEDDEQAVSIAGLLEKELPADRNPTIVSDRRLSPASPIQYRYGSFRRRFLQLPNGRTVPAMESQSGELIEDHRQAFISPPHLIDPFVNSGLAKPLPAVSNRLAERYVLISLLHRSLLSRIFGAVDVQTRTGCVIKCTDSAVSRLRKERELLNHVGEIPGIPRISDFVQSEGYDYLVLRHVPGRTWFEAVDQIGAEASFLSNTKLRSWTKTLIDTLENIHSRGVVHRDIKPDNLIVDGNDSVHIIDFDAAQYLGDRFAPEPLGTEGYTSRQQWTGAIPDAADDIYGLGALLFFTMTGSAPPRWYGQISDRREAKNTVIRLLKLWNPGADEQIVKIASLCLQPRRSQRPSLVEIQDRLRHAGDSKPIPQSKPYSSARRSGLPETAQTTNLVDAITRATELSGRIRQYLIENTLPQPTGLSWPNAMAIGTDLPSIDLNTGSGGIVLALADNAGSGSPGTFSLLSEATSHLVERSFAANKEFTHPGLFVGRSGVALAILRAGLALNDAAMIEKAEELAAAIAPEPYQSFDVFEGLAGRLQILLAIWKVTGSPTLLRKAIAAGDSILAGGEGRPSGLCWKGSEGYLLGYAHGAAGIGDALLELYEYAGMDRFLNAAKMAAGWLEQQALPTVHGGLAWPREEGGGPWWALWCHGATGIGQFFLRASRNSAAFPNALRVVREAASTVVCTRSIGPGRCHGFAGNIDFLLAAARQKSVTLSSILGLLDVFMSSICGNGRSLTGELASKDKDLGLMTGWAGVYATLMTAMRDLPLLAAAEG